MEKKYLVPCLKCYKSIGDDEEPAFCPECRQPYHHNCWAENGYKCKLKGCHGNTHAITTFVEKILLYNLKIQSELKSECPNCNRPISILYRYCPNCSFEANPPKAQKSFYLFPFLRFIHNYKQRFAFTFALLFIFIFCLVPAVIGLNGQSQSTVFPTETEVRFLTKTPFFTNTPQKQPTITPRPTIRPTNTRPPTQFSLEPIPSNYKCPDKSKIKLQVGASAVIGKLDVNLREQPVVPQVHGANVILVLRKGDKVQVIDGPTCAHDGTWWKLKTENGRVGWSREISFGNVLLIRTDK